MNARERLERIERELGQLRSLLADRPSPYAGTDADPFMGVHRLRMVTRRVLWECGAELEKVEVPGE